MAFDKSKLTGVSSVYPLKVSPYEQYMGDFENPSVVSKINSMIQTLLQMGRLTNQTVAQWNNVMDWIVNGGMDEIATDITTEKVEIALTEVMSMLDVSLDNGLKELAENVSDKKIDELLESGQFESMIQSSLVEINEVVENKLDGFNLQLADMGQTKANQSYVETILASAVSGAPKGFFNTLSALQTAYPEGTDGVFLVLADGHIYIWNNDTWQDAGLYQGIAVSDSAVGLKQTTNSLLQALKISEHNMNNSSNWELGGIDNTNGSLATSTTRIRNKSFIYAEKGTKIQFSNAQNFQFRLIKYSVVDESFIGFVDWVTSSNTVIELDNTYLIKLTMKKTSDTAFSISDISSAVSSYITSKIFVAKGEGGVLKSSTITAKDIDFLVESNAESNINLFDKTNITMDGYYDASSLSWVANTEFVQSSFVSVQTGDILTIPSFADKESMVVFKNSQGAIISGLTIPASNYARSFTVPSEAVQASVNLRKIYLATMMLVKNRTFPSQYVPYGKLEIVDQRLKESIYDYVNQNLPPIENPLTAKSLFVFGDSINRGYGNNNKGACEYIAEKNKMSITNLAVSGATHGFTSGRSHVYAQMQGATSENPDYIVFNGLTNDVNNVYSNGRTGEITEEYNVTFDTTTFCGGFEACCKLIKDNWDNAKVLFVAVHKMPGRDQTGQNVLQGLARDMCKKWSIPIVDLYNEGGLNTYIDVMFNTYTANNVGIPDGTHPNESGYLNFYVSPIENKLKSL